MCVIFVLDLNGLQLDTEILSGFIVLNCLQSICIGFAQHMLQNITFTLFNPSFVEWHVLSIAVLLHDPVCFFFFLQAHPDILEFCSIMQMNLPTKDRQTRPTNHDSNSTVRFRWDEIQMLECCLFISSNVVLMIYTKQFQCLSLTNSRWAAVFFWKSSGILHSTVTWITFLFSVLLMVGWKTWAWASVRGL